MRFARQLDPTSVDSTLRAAAAWLRKRDLETTSVLVGYCMGVIALRRTVGWASEFAAVAVWYGSSIAMTGITPTDVEVPIVASYGADDVGIPVGPWKHSLVSSQSHMIFSSIPELATASSTSTGQRIRLRRLNTRGEGRSTFFTIT